MSSEPDTILHRLVTSALEQLGRGEQPSIDELCAEQPNLKGDLIAALELARQLPTMHQEAQDQDPLIGSEIAGRYRLLRPLGAGAMGAVYHAEDLELSRPVAVKVLRTGLLNVAEAQARFLREAEATASVQHTAVVSIFDRGTTDQGNAYLVMEFLEGISLSELLDKAMESREVQGDRTDWVAEALGVPVLEEPSYLRACVRWTAALAEGLSAVHTAGVYHRDVKPSNIMVRANGEPVLLDFGIAAVLNHETLSGALTRDGAALGTPAYMAPESLGESAKPGPATDVYGLAATLYHLLTGQAPYTGSASQILARLATREPVPAFQLRVGLPRDLQAILDRGMERSPNARYKSASDLGSDLNAFLEYRPVVARPISSAKRAVRRLRRSKPMLAGGGVAVLALGLLGGFASYERWAEARDEQTLDAWEHMPPHLSIQNESNRRTASEAEFEAVSRVLDETVAATRNPIPAAVFRAAFRLDHGDPRGAAEDMRVVADSVNSSYARALAEAYWDLPVDAKHARSVPLDGLPDPNGKDDVFLAAYHRARVLDYTGAKEVLGGATLQDDLHTQELAILLMTVGIDSLPEAERIQPGLAMHVRAIQLEERIGRATANSSHLKSIALFHQARFEDALVGIREGLELAPHSLPILINGGACAYDCNQLELSKEYYARAIALRPRYLKPYIALHKVLLEKGDLEEAQELARTTPLPDSPPGERLRSKLLGEVQGERALASLEAGRSAEAREFALEAIAFLDRAEVGQDKARILSQGILDEDPDGIYCGLMRKVIQYPVSHRWLSLASHWRPAEPSRSAHQLESEYLQVMEGILRTRGAASPQIPE